jgi:gliding motility-associated protein GldM
MLVIREDFLLANPKIKKYFIVSVAIVLLFYSFQQRNSRINQDILNAFVLLDEGLVKTTENLIVKNETNYSIFDYEMEKVPTKVQEFRNMAYRVKDWADQLHYDIQELKIEIIKACDGENAPSLSPVEWLIGGKKEKKQTFNIDGNLIINKGNNGIPTYLMFNERKGWELKEKIERYRDFLSSITYEPKFIMGTLDTYNRRNKTGGYSTWETYHFANLPMISVIANLSKMQNDIRSAEADILENLLAQVGATDTRVNVLEAIVVAKSNYVIKGDAFEARILLAAYDSLQKPEILIGPIHRTKTGEYDLIDKGGFLPYDAKGRAIYKVPATTVGNFTLQGIIRMMTPDGVVNLPFSYEYQVDDKK